MPFPLTEQAHRRAGCNSTVLDELRMIIQSLSLEVKLSDAERFDRLEKIFHQVIFCDAEVLFAPSHSEFGRKLNLKFKVELLQAITREMDNLRQSYRPPALRSQRSPGDRREPGLAEGQESLGLSAQPGFPTVTRATSEVKDHQEIINEPVEGPTWPPALVEVIHLLPQRQQVLRTALGLYANEEKFVRYRGLARAMFVFTLVMGAFFFAVGGSDVENDRNTPGGLSEDLVGIFMLVMGSVAGAANLTAIGVEVGTRCKQSRMIQEINSYLLGLIPEAADLSEADLRERASRPPAYRTAMEENIWKELADKVKQILGKSQENPQGLKPEEVCCTICTGASNEEKGKIGMVRIVPRQAAPCFEGPLHRSCLDEWKSTKPDSSPICREPYYKDRDGRIVFWELDRAIATLEARKGGQQSQATLVTPPPSGSVSVPQLAIDILSRDQKDEKQKDEKQKEQEAAETKRTLASHQQTLTDIVTGHDHVHQTGETTIAMTSLASGQEEVASLVTPTSSHLIIP